MILQKNDQYAVECQTRMSSLCHENGDYCESEEDALIWVEFECWIDSGEGWICPACHENIMNNLVKMRYQQETEKTKQTKPKDGLNSDLEKGIDTVL